VIALLCIVVGTLSVLLVISHKYYYKKGIAVLVIVIARGQGFMAVNRPEDKGGLPGRENILVIHWLV
jgi:hypothetical protein